MDELNIKVNIPKGYEIDKEKSTFENIVLKPIKIDYAFVSRNLFYNNKVYYFTTKGSVTSSLITTSFADPNNCTSIKQAEKLLAINQLMNVAKYLNGNWKPSWENDNEQKYLIVLDQDNNKILIDWNTFVSKGIVHFKTKELAQRAIEILGEETVKLALSTDW